MKQDPKYSRLDKEIEIDEKYWAVSLVNTGSVLGGHSAIIVEGLQKVGPRLCDTELFYGFYDIKACVYDEEKSTFNVNKKGYIYRVTVHEGSQYPAQDITKYLSRTQLVTVESARRMIADIKTDRQAILDKEKAQHKDCEPGGLLDKSLYPQYELIGVDSIFGSKGRGMNCANWCADKLLIAGIGNGSLKKPGCLIL
jgi:hypothetical protein